MAIPLALEPFRKLVPGLSVPAMNPFFSDWREHLDYAFSTLDVSHHYEFAPEQELLERCVAHADRFARRRTADNVLLLVHPFYLPLTDAALLTAATERDAVAYLGGLLRALEKAPRDNLAIVLFDTPHHYAAATSLLQESGLVDDTLFTVFDEGEPLLPRAFSPYDGKRFFLCGGYNGRCLNDAVKALRVTTDELFVLQDIVIGSPKDSGERLRPSRIGVRECDDHQWSIIDPYFQIGLETFLSGERLRLPRRW